MRRKLYIVHGKIRYFPGFGRFGVVCKQVHDAITVGHEVNLFSHPHGDDILRRIIGNLLCLSCFEIIGPDIIGHSSPVIFPCPELPEYPVKSKLPAIWGVGTESSVGQRYFV